MAFTLRSIQTTVTGREIVRARALEGESITIGRAAQCDVHLPDLAVEPLHARIRSTQQGLQIQAAGTRGFILDGSEVQNASIDPAAGAELGFGTYRLTVSAQDGAVVLTLRKLDTATSKPGDLAGRRGFSLAGVLPGKRPIAWSLAAAILLGFLLLPVFSHILYDPSDKNDTVLGDASWSSGDLSRAHRGLRDECEACHVDAFVSVRNQTCASCHEDAHDHADAPRLAASRAGQPLGARLLQAVAQGLGREGSGACTDCHVEHEGKRFSDPRPQAFCADCHGALKARLPDTVLGDASDFGLRHPQFTPAVTTGVTSQEKVEVSLDKVPREDHGLAFPHKRHLEKLGGAARMAASIGAERGYGSGGLQCSDCHRATEDGVRFEPIRMERDCEGCHSLSYDRVGGIFRKLTHGDVDQLIADLSAGDLSPRPAPMRQRPEQYSPSGPYRFNFSAPVWRGLQIRTALSEDGICGECHRPAARAGGKPGIVPVKLPTRYLHQGWFDHDAHKQEKCSSCHAAQGSASSSDVLLPGIATCQTCHGGEDAAKADVPSSCAMCHSYHAADPAAPAHAARRDRVR